jgi:hypothetical protein
MLGVFAVGYPGYFAYDAIPRAQRDSGNAINKDKNHAP